MEATTPVAISPLTRCSLTLAFLTLIAAAGSSTSALTVSDGKDVSLVALIANPGNYDGKAVRVRGFAVLEFENTRIYLSQEDARTGNDANGFIINLTTRTAHDRSELHGKHVMLEATFVAESMGGSVVGYFRDITLLAPVGPLRDFETD